MKDPLKGWAESPADVRLRPIAKLRPEIVVLAESVELRSPVLAQRMREAKAHALAIIGVSAGPEVDDEIDRRWQQGLPDESMLLNAWAAAAVEYARGQAVSRLRQALRRHRIAVLEHNSPGYAGWSLGDQQRLLALLSSGPIPGPLEALESGALRPVRSTLAVAGLARTAVAAQKSRCDDCPGFGQPGCLCATQSGSLWSR